VSPGRDDLAQLADRRYQTGAGSGGASAAPAGLDEVRLASEISALAASALRQAVDLARTAGRTWQELGDVLGVTRQAAFQRFGHPVDPRTGEPMRGAMVPGAAARATPHGRPPT
jgi:hypothetical protein